MPRGLYDTLIRPIGTIGFDQRRRLCALVPRSGYSLLRMLTWLTHLLTGWARDSEENICPWAEDMLKAFGVRRFVMGHEIQRHVSQLLFLLGSRSPYAQGITARCDGQVILIDTGMCDLA